MSGFFIVRKSYEYFNQFVVEIRVGMVFRCFLGSFSLFISSSFCLPQDISIAGIFPCTTSLVSQSTENYNKTTSATFGLKADVSERFLKFPWNFCLSCSFFIDMCSALDVDQRHLRYFIWKLNTIIPITCCTFCRRNKPWTSLQSTLNFYHFSHF